MKKNGLFLAMMALCLCASKWVLCNNSYSNAGNPMDCQPPSTIVAWAVKHNSATLVWHGDAAQYEYAYMRSEYSSALSLLSDGKTINDTIVTIEGLRPNTSYSFYVRSRCGQSVSSWSQAISFKTCSSETSLPYSQNFESCGVGSEASLPPCWFAYCIEVGVDTAQPDIGHVFPITSPVIQGRKSLAVTTEILEEGNSVRRCGYAVMPLFSGSSDHYILYFDGRSTNISGTRILVALTDSPKTASSFVPLDTLSFNVSKENYEIHLEKKLLNNRYILFLNLGPADMPIGSLDTAIIDNVSLMSPSHYCPYPYIHRNIKPTSNSATIKWEGEAGQYEVKWKKLRDFVWSDLAIVKEQSFGISELEPGTSYHVWVRAICNDSLRSEWASVNFKTLPEEGKPEEPKTCPVPVNFHLVDVGMYNATFDWTPVGDETSWVVKVWNKDGSWTKTADYHPFTFGTNARSDIMRESDDLHRCVEYQAAIHPICDMGWDYVPYENWEYSQPIAFKSQCCPDVENLRIGSVRETAVWLEWEGRTNNYDVMLADITDPLIDPIWEERIYNNGAGTFPDPNASQTRSFWLDDLLPYRKYEIRVRSECNDGTLGEWSSVVVETLPYLLDKNGIGQIYLGMDFDNIPSTIQGFYDRVRIYTEDCMAKDDVKRIVFYYKKDSLFEASAYYDKVAKKYIVKNISIDGHNGFNRSNIKIDILNHLYGIEDNIKDLIERAIVYRPTNNDLTYYNYLGVSIYTGSTTHNDIGSQNNTNKIQQMWVSLDLPNCNSDIEEEKSKSKSSIGLFSVAPNVQVQFAPGNLQYQVTNGSWRFAEHQYERIYEYDTNINSKEYGWIDLFGWGTGNNPTNVSRKNTDYLSFFDWGNNISEEWRTLSIEEWQYLVHDRIDAWKKIGEARIDTGEAKIFDGEEEIYGVVILPDNWVLPSGCKFTPDIILLPDSISIIGGKVPRYVNTGATNWYTTLQWEEMEKAGAIFLPWAGRRRGEKHLEPFYGYYWTSTPKGNYEAHYINLGSGLTVKRNGMDRSWRLSIRLVRNAK